MPRPSLSLLCSRRDRALRTSRSLHSDPAAPRHSSRDGFEPRLSGRYFHIRRRRRIASCPRQPVFLTAWYSSFNPARICSRACSGRIPRSPGLQFHVYHLFLDCGFIIPHDKALFCDEVTLIKKKIGAEKAPVLNRSIHFRRWSPSVSRSVIAPRFSSTRPSSEKLLSIRATASRAELMC